MPHLRDDLRDVLNSFARQVHRINLDKGFHTPCDQCDGSGLTDGDGRAVPVAEAARTSAHGTLRTCRACDGRGSRLDEKTFYRMTNHIHGEVNELFQLTRDNNLPALCRCEGVPGLAQNKPGEMQIPDDRPAKPAVPDKHLPAHPAAAVELADILIRTLDLAAAMGLDVGRAVEDKVRFNESRPHLHARRH